MEQLEFKFDTQLLIDGHDLSEMLFMIIFLNISREIAY